MTPRETPAAVVARIEDAYGLERGTLAGRVATRYVGIARREAVAALRGLGLSLADVGRLLGGREHSTILHYERTA